MNIDFYQLHLLFQNFMSEKGYFSRKRENLISPLYPTTFTMSGGPDLAYRFWQGDQKLAGNHITNQPCVRHWDIELTGDNKHLSFFNMFVADSIEGFSRLEVLQHFFEFFTEYLHLDPDRFYASYFAGGKIKDQYFEPDIEVKEIWKKIGIPKERIIPFSDDIGMEAFVANSVEPVGGYRSELFYDTRGSSRCNHLKEFMTAENKGYILEFFTHVLYNLEVTASKDVYTLKQMNRVAIAAGFGPQRIMRILEGVDSIGDISILQSLQNHLGNRVKKFPKESIIVTDHIRGIIFLIKDGVLNLHGQKNRSRRHLFRRYCKNFKKNFKNLSFDNEEQVLASLIQESIQIFSILFPEFIKVESYIYDEFMRIYESIED